MLRSYLTLAWKVLRRRPFYTFISLFGISFTLMILLVVVAFFDHLSGPQIPEKHLDRMLFISSLRQKYREGDGWRNSPVSPRFFNSYVRTLRTPERTAMVSMTEDATAYPRAQRLKIDLRYTDDAFWQVLDFTFVEGRPFSTAEVGQAAHVIVINESTARAYFGTSTGIVGREADINLRHYRIVGVVRDVPALRLYSYADVWAPYTLSSSEHAGPDLAGSYVGIILAHKAADLPAIQAEFQQTMGRIPIPNPKEIRNLYAFADPLLGTITHELLSSDRTDPSNHLGTFYTLCTVLGLLFMLLPTLNLVNLNVTRIMERSSEIGVRKAFGASGRVLVGQFLVENLVLSLLGGTLGLALAAAMLHLLNESHLVAYSQFGLNWRVFGWGLGLAVIFGLLSGVYPAWKMSRLNPVEAIRGQLGK